jgi:predicted metal-dependent hydrolase
LLGRAGRDACGGVGVRRVEGLGCEERLGNAVELLAMLRKQIGGLGVGLLDDSPHLLVDQPLCLR